jgi:predicted nucleic acid-binding Zn ribbon protein
MMRTASVTSVKRGRRGQGGQLSGRKGKQRWGDPVDSVDNRLRVRRGQPAGMFGVRTPPSEDAWRMAGEDRVCPICLQGPYRLLGGHTYAAHGMSAREIKDLAGLTAKASTAAPDLGEVHSARAKKQTNRTPPPHPPRQSRTAAGRRICAENMRRARTLLTPEQLAAAQARGRRRQSERAAERRANPEMAPCVICGTYTTRHRKITCSEACRAEAQRRGRQAARASRLAKATCAKGHRYDGVKKSGARSCSICERSYQAAYRQRRADRESP